MQAMMETTGEYGLEKIRYEFEKLFYALRRSHESERRLTHKCRQLNEEIAANVAKVGAVMEMTQQEEIANADLRQVINYLYRRCELCRLCVSMD